MRAANIYQHKELAGELEELGDNSFRFTYRADYRGEPISFSMPLSKSVYEFKHFPALFEGLLPEGAMLEGFLKRQKLDRNDFFGQLLAVGNDVVGSLQVGLKK